MSWGRRAVSPRALSLSLLVLPVLCLAPPSAELDAPYFLPGGAAASAVLEADALFLWSGGAAGGAASGLASSADPALLLELGASAPAPAPACSTGMLAAGYDRPMPAYQYEPVADVGACSAACCGDARCTSFTFLPALVHATGGCVSRAAWMPVEGSLAVAPSFLAPAAAGAQDTSSPSASPAGGASPTQAAPTAGAQDTSSPTASPVGGASPTQAAPTATVQVTASPAASPAGGTSPTAAATAARPGSCGPRTRRWRG